MPADRLFDHTDFEVERIVAAKRGERVAVVIPARDEAETIGAIVDTIRTELVIGADVVDELIVVDDTSSDGTAAAAAKRGAAVVRSVGRGKGAAMWTGLQACTASVVVFCDGDLQAFGSHFITGLCGPLLVDHDIAFVKASYDRPRDGRPGEGGRVTELTARPALRLLSPAVADITQPLGGEVAGRRDVLELVPFVEGYGVDVALLLDIAALVGLDRIAQVHLGVRMHRHRALSELSVQADAVLHAILDRTGVHGVPPVAERPPLRRQVDHLASLNDISPARAAARCAPRR